MEATTGLWWLTGASEMLKKFYIVILIAIATLGALLLFATLGIKIRQIGFEGIRAQHIEFLLLGGLRAESIEFEIPAGMSGQVSHFSMEWSPQSLLERRLIRVELGSIQLFFKEPKPRTQEESVQAAPPFPKNFPLRISSFRLGSLEINDQPYLLSDLSGSVQRHLLRISASVHNKNMQVLEIKEGSFNLNDLSLNSSIQTSGFTIKKTDLGGSLSASFAGTAQIRLKNWKDHGSQGFLFGEFSGHTPQNRNAKANYSIRLQGGLAGLELSGVEIGLESQEVLLSTLSSEFKISPEGFSVSELNLGTGSFSDLSWSGGHLSGQGAINLTTTSFTGAFFGLSNPAMSISTISITGSMKPKGILDLNARVENLDLPLWGKLSFASLRATGTLTEAKGQLTTHHYQFKDSVIPATSSTFLWNPTSVQGRSKVPDGTLFPRQFLSSVSSLVMGTNTTGIKEPSSLEVDWTIESDPKKGIEVHDELFQFTLVPEFSFEVPGELRGILRIPKGQLRVSDTLLELKEPGWIRFWPSRIHTGQERIISTTSLGGLSATSLNLPQFVITRSAEEMGIETGIEVRLILGTQIDGEQVLVRLSGFYPEFNIQVEGANPLEVIGALKAVLGSFGLGGAAVLPTGQSPEEWIAKQAMEKAGAELEALLNSKLDKVGIRVDSKVLEGGGSELSIEKRLGKNLILELQQRHENEMEAIRTKKLKYQLPGSGTLFFRIDEKGNTGQQDSAIGVQKRIRF